MSKTPQVGGNSNRKIREAIQKIALHGLYDSDKGAFYSTERKLGWVSAVYLEGEFAGTVDVIEYNSSIKGSDGEGTPLKHEHVWLSVIQDSMQGYVVVPKMNSDVIIYYDPVMREEFVVMASVVDIIQVQSEKEVFIGVKERKPYIPGNEEDNRLSDIEFTGKSAGTTYDKDKITTTVTDGKKTTTVTVTPDKSVTEVGNTKVQVEDGKVYLGDTDNTSHAVLGEELVDVLTEILQAIAQIKTTTSLGPQPAINMAQFLVLKQKISAFKTSLSGFLTNKVLIQK